MYAQSARRAQATGIDDTTSMLFKFASGASGYLGTFIGTAETWRMQVFGSKGWAEVGDVEHLSTWQVKTCFVDLENPFVNQRPEVTRFPSMSTERAELEYFADAVSARRPIAIMAGDEVHGVAVLDAVMQSVKEGRNVVVG